MLVSLPNCLGVGTECTVSLDLNMPLILFLVLLLRNDSEELVALLLCLRGHHDLLLDKLLSTGLIKFNSLLSSQFSLFFLFSTGSTLTVFEGSLGS